MKKSIAFFIIFSSIFLISCNRTQDISKETKDKPTSTWRISTGVISDETEKTSTSAIISSGSSERIATWTSSTWADSTEIDETMDEIEKIINDIWNEN